MDSKQLNQFIKSKELSDIIGSLDPEAKKLYDQKQIVNLKVYLKDSYDKNQFININGALGGVIGVISSLYFVSALALDKPEAIIVGAPFLGVGLFLMVYGGYKGNKYRSFEDNVDSLVNSIIVD